MFQGDIGKDIRTASKTCEGGEGLGLGEEASLSLRSLECPQPIYNNIYSI